MAGLDELSGQRYLSLETYRRTGTGVRTPLWFAAAPDADGMRLYSYSLADSGKAKRIRSSGAVKVAPCDMRGTVTGDWVEARASLVTGDEFDRGMRLLNRKYWPWKAMLDVLSRLRPGAQRVMIVIRAV
jgi:PPOX class probable F420-dependent enzyme